MWPGEKVVLNAAVAELPEGCHQKWGKMRWGTGRAASGAEERKDRSGERGSSVEEAHWTVWDKKMTFDLLGGSSWPSAAVRSVAQ